MDERILLFQSNLSACSYLAAEQSCNQIVDPNVPLTPALYGLLLERGFRRSGEMVYRPNCPTCQQCQSCRVPISKFSPRRSQKRCWKRIVKRLRFAISPPIFNQQHYDLYIKYTKSRHTDGDMANASPEEYMNFLGCSWSHTEFIEIHLDDALLAVAVTDCQPDSMSAVYTFFDPEHEQLSPGIIAVLAQIDLAKTRHLPWLYLGYWVKDSPKMSYKTNFQPIEIYHRNHWSTYSTDKLTAKT